MFSTNTYIRTIDFIARSFESVGKPLFRDDSSIGFLSKERNVFLFSPIRATLYKRGIQKKDEIVMQVIYWLLLQNPFGLPARMNPFGRARLVIQAGKRTLNRKNIWSY